MFKNIPISEENKINAIEFLNHYKSGQYLYPNVIIRSVKISKDVQPWILKALIDNQLVEEERYYRCSRCASSTASYCKEEYEMLEDLYCEICDDEINLDDYEVVYRIK